MSRRRLLEVLGLGDGSGVDEIKKRYRQLARRYHPDLSQSDERATARFRAIRCAYETLLVGTGSEPEGVDEVVPLTVRKRSSASPHERAASVADQEDQPPSRKTDPDRLVRIVAELRDKLDKSRRDLHRTNASVSDAETKAAVAHARDDHQTGRHFERRVEADRSKAYALLGQIAELERELAGLELRGEQYASSRGDRGTGRPGEDAKRAVDDELAALKARRDAAKKKR